jgi:hypothetical protein
MLALVVAGSDKKTGKPETFTKEQNDALREELVEWADAHNYVSERLGELLGVRQQTANGYYNGTGNFSWPAACALAWQLGYLGVDELLIEHNVLRHDGVKVERTDRGHAIALARRMHLSEVAIERVNAREKEATHHVTHWWVDRYIQEHRAILEEREARRHAHENGDGPKPRGRPPKNS